MTARLKRGRPFMRIPPAPDRYTRDWAQGLQSFLDARLSELTEQILRLGEGRRKGFYEEYSAVPAAGLYLRGDFVPKIDPEDSASAGFTVASRYTLTGWLCVQDGSASASSFVGVYIPTRPA